MSLSGVAVFFLFAKTDISLNGHHSYQWSGIECQKLLLAVYGFCLS